MNYPRLLILPLFLLTVFLSEAAAQANPQPVTIEILGNKSAGEDVSGQWVAVMSEPVVVNTSDGYSPTGPQISGAGDLPTIWERPIEYRWNFGDGTGILSTGERSSISHAFTDDGTFNLKVEAWTSDGLIASGTKEIKVRNRNPVELNLAAVEIDPATGQFELTASAIDAADDVVTYDWDFGDGGNLVDGGWKINHFYEQAGTYTVSVTARDEDGGERNKTMRVVVAGGAAEEEDSIDSVDGEEFSAEAVDTSFKMTIAGSVGTQFDGEVRSIAGIHLSAIKGGDVCRFMFSAWDDSGLVHVMSILDLAGLPEAGARYTFRSPRVSVSFQPTAERYEGRKKLIMPGGTRLGLGVLADPLAGLMDDSEISEKVGVRPGPRETRPAQAMPAVTPFGLEDEENFTASSGTVEMNFVPHDRAVGTVNLSLSNTDEESPFPAITMKGEFALDLKAMQRDGLMLYKYCGPGAFAVKDVYPEPGRQHHYGGKGLVKVIFTRDYDVDSLDSSTFQLTYPAAGTGVPVPVETRIQRRGRVAFLRPVEDLMNGVRYTARVKTGSEGVRGQNGIALDSTNDDKWYTWSFTTRVGMEPGGQTVKGDENLGCHSFQSVRDAPLIAGKPAVTRVYANWKEHPQVHADAQVKEFDARVVLMKNGQEFVSGLHHFVRPNLWAGRGIKKSEAAHTANIFWTPDSSVPDSVRMALKVTKKPGESYEYGYWSRCSTPVWEHAPKLKIDFYMMAINAWEDDAVRSPMTPKMVEIVRKAEIYARQVFPFATIDFNFIKIIRHPPGRRLLNAGGACDKVCASNLLAAFSTESAGADIIIGFTPFDDLVPGGETKLEVSAAEPAYVVMALDDKPEHFDRWVYGIAHEVGHTLWLQHRPYVDEPQRAALLAIRDSAFANSNQPLHKYEGIEGFRIAADGRSGFNKSSVEGNAESDWLTPLMYPGTIPYRSAFILRHQYLKIQKELEKRGGIPRGAPSPL